VLSESHFSLIEGVGSDIHERPYSKNWMKQLQHLPVLHFNRCLTTEYTETTAYFYGNFCTTKSTYRGLRVQQLSERTVFPILSLFNLRKPAQSLSGNWGCGLDYYLTKPYKQNGKTIGGGVIGKYSGGESKQVEGIYIRNFFSWPHIIMWRNIHWFITTGGGGGGYA
jgi:hypothetical protein